MPLSLHITLCTVMMICIWGTRTNCQIIQRSSSKLMGYGIFVFVCNIFWPYSMYMQFSWHHPHPLFSLLWLRIWQFIYFVFFVLRRSWIPSLSVSWFVKGMLGWSWPNPSPPLSSVIIASVHLCQGVNWPTGVGLNWLCKSSGFRTNLPAGLMAFFVDPTSIFTICVIMWMWHFS